MPGAGCGTTKPLRTVSVSHLPSEITSAADYECGAVKEEGMFAEVMKKVGFAKCKHEDVEHCRHVRGDYNC